MIAPVAKATAVLARDVALEPAMLPGTGRAQTKEEVVMGETVGKGWRRRNSAEKNKMHFFERGSGDRVFKGSFLRKRDKLEG